MRLAVTVVAPHTGHASDVVLDADPAAPVADIAAALARFLRCAGPAPERPAADRGAAGTRSRVPPSLARWTFAASPPVAGRDPDTLPLYVGGRRVAPEQPLAGSPVRDGCVISLGGPEGCVPPEAAGVAEIRVTAGPAAGAIYRLPPGAGWAGSDRAAGVRIRDPAVPGRALAVAADELGGCQVAPCPGVTASLDGAPVTAPGRWLPGQRLAIGESVLELARYTPPDAALARSADGSGLDFNRPPRLLAPARGAAFTLPAPPPAAERRPLPVLMIVLPLVMGVAMAFFLRQVYLLAMAGLSPVMLAGSALGERRQGRKAAAARQAEYAGHKARIERDAAGAVAAELAALRGQCPDPAEVLSVATGPRRRLWERRRTDPDYLLLRAGTADLPSSVRLTDPTADEHRRTVTSPLPDAPVTIPLRERGVVGVAGPADSARAVARWLVAQAAVLHSPVDLRIYVLTDHAGRSCWEWVRWLPHCRPAAGGTEAGPGGAGAGPGGAGCAAQVGNDAESVAARIAELLALVAARQQAARDGGRLAGGSQPGSAADVLVVIDGSRKLRSLPGVIQLLREGPGSGVYAVCLDSDERLLPAECQAVAVCGPDGLRVQQAMAAAVTGGRADRVAPGWCARLARAIAPVRDVSADAGDDALPDSARLLGLLGLDPPAATAIAARWRAGGRSTTAVVGESYDGPFTVDLRRDGPHGLIAGTTGSGKSELLQTIIASLAAANRPDELTFVLVDYKGGSAFADCARLPHTAGMVTDLGPHLVQRALASLTAELTRREHLLARAGAKDIEDYQRDAGRRTGLAPLPRLVIVIDEFASLVRDLPDFVTGLVGIAQRGRSLGLHLILATQRPSGVVSADIRANASLRIALRVTDPGESSDVLDAPDAAAIAVATPGRAYVRLGHASLIPFQAGRVGGPRPRTGPAPSPRQVRVAPVGWADLGKPEPAPPAEAGRGEEEVTDLKLLVDEMRQAARDLGIPAQPSPWLPPLPGVVQLSTVMRSAAAARQDTREADHPAGGSTRRDEGKPVPFGLLDLPKAQVQAPAELDPDTFSHLIAAGAPRSGRSQLLRTIAGSLALARDCADVHLYGIDCGNGALLPLAELPHCGAVAGRAEAERAGRLLRRLDAELTRRQELLASGGFASVTEQRAADSGGRLPHIFLLLDQWEGFTPALGAADGGALTDVLTRILGEGASAGMHLVMTGDRSLLAGRISALCGEKLVFKLADREDYALAGLRHRDLPEDIPPGRAVRAGSGTEVQVALLGPDPTGQGQAAALRAVARSCALRDGSVPPAARPFRVDAAPARITFDQAWALRPAAASPLWGLAGVGGDSLAALGPDLASGVPAFTVAGPPGSGRSAVLVSMARSFLAAGTRVVLLTPRPSPLRSLTGAAGVAACFTGTSLGEDDLAGVLAAVEGPLAVLADDAELLRDCDASGELSRMISAGARDVAPAFRRALVLAGDPEAGLCAGFGGWQTDARRARRGALTAPSSVADGELIGTRLTRGQTGQPPRPGRCLLNTGDGRLVTVTVPAL